MILSTGCMAEAARPPIARITTSPTAILARDEFRTEVTVDGRTSAAFDDSGAPLAYAWRFLDDEARTSQSPVRDMLVVTFRGEHPPRIELTVTAPGGETGAVIAALPLTAR